VGAPPVRERRKKGAQPLHPAGNNKLSMVVKYQERCHADTVPKLVALERQRGNSIAVKV